MPQWGQDCSLDGLQQCVRIESTRRLAELTKARSASVRPKKTVLASIVDTSLFRVGESVSIVSLLS